jgi:TolB-like protein
MSKRAIRGWTAALLLLLATPAVAEPPRLTVLYFDNNTGDKTYDPLSKGLADMMITDLASAPGVVVVEREKLEALLGELRLQRSKYFDPRTAQKIGKGIGAAYAVTGAFVSMEPNIRIDVRVIKIDSAAVVKATTVNGKKDDFFTLWQALSQKLVEGLAAELPGLGGDRARAAAEAQRV